MAAGDAFLRFLMEEEDGSFHGPSSILPLLDLPDDLLLRVMTGTGSRAIVSGAAACRRLKGTKARPTLLISVLRAV